MKNKIIVEGLLEKNRIDSYIASIDENYSRNAIQKLCDNNKVYINGTIANKKDLVFNKDIIEYEYFDDVKLDALPENIPINIVFEDKNLIVVDKPKGMVVHPGAGNYNGTLVNSLLFHCGDNLSSINGVIRPGIVHRIDKDTSGLLVIAKDNKTHEGLAELFSRHDIERVYKAIVCFDLKNEDGTIDVPIGRHPTKRKQMCVTQSNSRRAVTHYSVIEHLNGYSYINCKLETGRTHQIRVHMDYIGHPVLGDPVYGNIKQNFIREGQFLHASVLGFVHPITKEFLHFESDIHEDFKDMLVKLRKK